MMPRRSPLSLLCFAVHLGLYTGSLGAAVDAPAQGGAALATGGGGEEGRQGVKGEVREEKAGGGRYPRSLPDYQDSVDYGKLGYSDDRSRRRNGEEREVGGRYSEDTRGADTEGSWHLAAQVAKRQTSRGRGEYYRAAPPEEEVKLVQNSLAEAAAGAASTMLARQQRNGRRYDVPQIGEYYTRGHCTGAKNWLLFGMKSVCHEVFNRSEYLGFYTFYPTE